MIIERNFVIMKKKFHIMFNLFCFVILNTNFMKFFDIIFKWKKKKERDVMIIQKNHQVKTQITRTKFLLTKRIDFFKNKSESKKRQINVYAEKSVMLNHVQKKNVKIKHKFLIFENYVFESIQKIDLSIFSCFFEIHVVVSNVCDVVSMINFGKASAKIYSEQFFERVQKFKTFKFLFISITFNYEKIFFEKFVEIDETINFFEIKISEKESALTSDVSKHWNEKYHEKMTQLLKKHAALFRPKFEKFRNDIKMFIFFKNESDITDLKQTFYFMSTRNKRVMNEMLNPFFEKRRVQKILLKIVSSTSSSIFVIWKNEKSRVIIDFKRINTRLYSDAYFFSKQNTILFSLNDSEIFSFINLTKEFFQQKIESKDWWKIIFVTSHRGLKWLTINNMKLNNTFKFFQSRMEKIFGFYFWKFVFVYMNDIIVYFRDSEIHLHHFDEIFRLLKKSEMTLTLKKCHFVYFNIKTLKHYVFRLRFSILKKKIQAIRDFRFSRTFRELETVIKFFDYYRKFVIWYVYKKKSLQQLKTTEFKNSFLKKNVRFQWINKIKLIIEKFSTDSNNRVFILIKKCFQSWNELKKALIIVSTLAFSDFFLSFKLYVNESKKRRFEIALHQIEKNEIKRSIFYFSKCFSNVEIRYWTIELKAETLVWILTKLSQYFDDDFFTIVTNHFALKTALQTNTIEKRFARFNEWIMFLAKFESRMTIIHKSKTQHQNVDDLSKLLCESDQITFSVNVIFGEKDLLKKIAKKLFIDRIFVKMMKKLNDQIEKIKNNEKNSSTKYQVYRLNFETNLLYVKNRSDFDKICIFEKCQKAFFEYGHD